MIDKASLKELLKKHIIELKFVKVDGTERQMTCTLKENELPKLENKEPKKEKRINENVLAVWDLDKKAFRSFRLDSVREYQISNNH